MSQNDQAGDGPLKRPVSHLAKLVADMERAEFEKWAKSAPDVLDVHMVNGVYSDDDTSRCWAGWQARAALVKPCRGIAHRGCNYLAVCGSICDKCGQAV